MLSTKPPKCPQCRRRMENTRQRLHDECVEPWIARQLAKQAEAKKKRERAETRQRRDAVKRLPDLHREAQAAFNEWTRLRDARQPCISCGAPPPDPSDMHAGRDAGHFRSVGGAPHLRYHEDNVHAQCVSCNQWGAGRAVEYRRGLLERIGLARVEVLECDNRVHKWSRLELCAIRDAYRARVRELKKERAAA